MNISKPTKANPDLIDIVRRLEKMEKQNDQIISLVTQLVSEMEAGSTKTSNNINEDSLLKMRAKRLKTAFKKSAPHSKKDLSVKLREQYFKS